MNQTDKIYEVKVHPDKINEAKFIYAELKQKHHLSDEAVNELTLIKRSIDSRGGHPVYVLRYQSKNSAEQFEKLENYHVSGSKPVVNIIGAGPAGYFAALQLLAKGIKPILFDRGKDVQSRRRDLRAIMQESKVNPDSNYCFGEGGAGTYSDGKLYTRSTKRGDTRTILELFCAHGADKSIQIDANPHIGTNKLPNIIASMRQTIENAGGEIHFGKRLVDFTLKDEKISEIHFEDGSQYPCDYLILATGHSARDIFHLLHAKNILIEAKPFALGCRVEHPQTLIDEIQYKCKPRHQNLPPASYSTVVQVQDRGVFSFCMCPGGMIVPSATAPGELVVNGMSPSRRDSPFSNSGLVTSIELEDIPGEFGQSPLRAMYFQQKFEQEMFQFGDGSQKSPTLRLKDFTEGKLSADLPDTSYIPGIYPAPLSTLLPEKVNVRLKQGLTDINRKLKGYVNNEAIITGLESRTSSPVRIPREKETYQHPQITNLFPCGEGAGYAGGIASAAIDGMNVAKAIIEKIS
jgi:uncharacterized FAD-dependent dehydrogenase